MRSKLLFSVPCFWGRSDGVKGYSTQITYSHPAIHFPGQANSPDRDDLLPGLCVLAQRWVADVALGSFRGTQGATFSLEGWFEDDGVRWAACANKGLVKA